MSDKTKIADWEIAVFVLLWMLIWTLGLMLLMK